MTFFVCVEHKRSDLEDCSMNDDINFHFWVNYLIYGLVVCVQSLI